MKAEISKTELKPIFDKINESSLNDADKRLAKAYLLQADRIADVVLWATAGVKRLAGLMAAKPARRRIARVSKHAH